LDNVKTELQKVIALWKSNYDGRPSCPKALGYKLDHKYTDANLQFNHLKGTDQVRLEYLREICGRNGFSVFLANVELARYGECYQQFDESCWRELYFDAVNGTAPEIHGIDASEESIHLTVIVDLDGSEILTNVPLDDDIFVQAEPFDQDPDEEDWSGPTGNEGVSATHFYRTTVSSPLLQPRQELSNE
jgi:hypothetical protein